MTCYFGNLFPHTGKCEGSQVDVQLSFGSLPADKQAVVGDEVVSTFVRSCAHHKPIGALLTKMARNVVWPD